MKLKISLFIILIIAILGSIELYKKRNFRKKIELIKEEKYGKKIDYSKYIQLAPKRTTIKKRKIYKNNKPFKFKIINSKKNKKNYKRRITKKEKLDIEMEKAILEMK